MRSTHPSLAVLVLKHTLHWSTLELGSHKQPPEAEILLFYAFLEIVSSFTVLFYSTLRIFSISSVRWIEQSCKPALKFQSPLGQCHGEFLDIEWANATSFWVWNFKQIASNCICFTLFHCIMHFPFKIIHIWNSFLRFLKKVCRLDLCAFSAPSVPYLCKVPPRMKSESRMQRIDIGYDQY